MKKIFIMLLFYFASKQIAVAQQITSTLTQLTTDLMTTENRNNFNWQHLAFQTISARIRYAAPIYTMFVPDEGAGGVNGGGSSGTVPCECPPWIKPGPECDNWKTYCKDDQIAGGSYPPSILNPNYWIFWGIQNPGVSIGFGSGTTFNYPPAQPPNFVPLSSPYGGIGGGTSGGAALAPANPTVPPPKSPADVDDPIGGSAASQQKKDSIIYETLPCNDSINKAIEKRVTKDLQDIRAANSQADSIYNRVTNGYPSEQSMTGGRDSSGAIQTTAVQDSYKDNMVLILQNISQYNKDITIHSHTEVVYGRPDIFDIYKTLTLIDSGRYRNSVNTGFVFSANGNVFAVTVKDADAVHLFLSQYPSSANLDKNQRDFFNHYSKLYYRYDKFLKLMENNNIDNHLGAMFAMAYLLSHPLLKDAVSFYRANSINDPFYKLNADLDYSKGLDPIIKIQTSKCN